MANPLQFPATGAVRSGQDHVADHRREVVLTTGMVFVMAALTAVFFALVDWIIRMGVGQIIG